MLEASKEAERSYLFKTNSLLMNAGTTPYEKVVSIGETNEYSCGQEEILDYSSLNNVECSAQLETKASNKEELL